MTDFSSSQTQNKTYVDSYVPPSMSANPSAPATSSMPPLNSVRPPSSVPPTNSMPAITSMPTPPAQASSSSPASSSSQSQNLEDQNIFHLLGVEDATEAEKESFLDELQQVIWEDFLENDVDLLLTEEELVEFKKISDKKELSEDDRQGQMVEFLEKLIPDLEKIMLEKALELKEEMLRERLAQMSEEFKDQSEKMAKIQEAYKRVEEQQWRTAADILNAIQA